MFGFVAFILLNYYLYSVYFPFQDPFTLFLLDSIQNPFVLVSIPNRSLQQFLSYLENLQIFLFSWHSCNPIINVFFCLSDRNFRWFIELKSIMCLAVLFGCQYKYMNYQSFLSSLLQSKYYSQQEISELTSSIQRNSGSKIMSMKLSQAQIFLYCPNRQFYGCPFSHLFCSINSSPGPRKFQLQSSTQKHSIECQESKNALNSKEKIFFKQKLSESPIQPQSAEKFSQIETCFGSPISKEAIINFTKNNFSLSSNFGKKLYTEEQFALLKKELQLQSKGFLSKSTEFQPGSNNNIIKRIQFHCKFQASCPYEAYLKIEDSSLDKINSSEKKQYSLQIINTNHLAECLLQEEIISYNENTMKIDRKMQVLSEIIQQNQESLKPKEILKKFADKLGEEEEFLYKGLDKKINKRAIKKYFDNCVAKVRSRVYPEEKSSKVESPKRSKVSQKIDEDYQWK